MKSILLSALLALGAHAFNETNFNVGLFAELKNPPHNYTAHPMYFDPIEDFIDNYNGTIKSLGDHVTLQELQDGTECFNAMRTVISQLIETIQTKDVKAFLMLIQEMNDDFLQKECQAYKEDILKALAKHTDISKLPETAKATWETHFPNVIKYFTSFAKRVPDASSKYHVERFTGQEFAIFLRVLLAIDTTPEVKKVVPPQNPASFNIAKFIKEYIPQLIDGMNSASEWGYDDTIECTNQIADVIDLVDKVKKDADPKKKLADIQDLIQASIKGIQLCQKETELDEMVIEPIISEFVSFPKESVWDTIVAIGENFDSFYHIYQEILNATYTGENYTLINGEDDGTTLYDTLHDTFELEDVFDNFGQEFF